MSRTLSTEMQAVASAEVVRPVYLIDMDFDSGEVNLWSGLGSLIYNGKTYVGAGDLLSLSSVSENSELTASGMNIVLSGINQSLINIARDEGYQGRPVVVSLGAFDDTGDIIASPVIVFQGFMDVMSISDSGETSTISITIENKLISFERASVRRYTAEDQKIDHPNDKGFEYVAKIQQKEIIWGRPNGNSSNAGQSPGDVYDTIRR